MNRGAQLKRASPEQELKRTLLPIHSLIKTILTESDLFEKLSLRAVIDLTLVLLDPDGSIACLDGINRLPDESYVRLTAYFVVDLLQVLVISMQQNRGYLTEDDYLSLGELLGSHLHEPRLFHTRRDPRVQILLLRQVGR